MTSLFDTPNFQAYTCPLPIQRHERVVMGHGAGGQMSHDLLQRLFLPELGQAAPRALDDAAVLHLHGHRLALSTDSHVVSPLFFPGGDIGRLAVCGTVNDLAMMGAQPLALTSGFVLEEGLPLTTLTEVVRAMQAAAAEAGVVIAAGDTKVVQKGHGDGLYINTAGVGVIPPGVNISGANAQPGDVVLLSGPVGDHGIAVMSARADLGFETELRSDVAPLNGLVAAMLAAGPVHVLRDPTRGGLATALYDIAEQSRVSLHLYETRLPVRPAVAAACDMLGLDVWYVANEGKLVACVPPARAEAVLQAMRAHPYGREAVILGEVQAAPAGQAQALLHTAIGGTRLLDRLPGEMLPRIC